MTEPMLERVARALCVQAGHDPEEMTWQSYGHPLLSRGQQLAPRWREHRRQAKAALESMREPDDQMTQAGALTFHRQPQMHGPHKVWREKATRVWQAMLDAALDEEGS